MEHINLAHFELNQAANHRERSAVANINVELWSTLIKVAAAAVALFLVLLAVTTFAFVPALVIAGSITLLGSAGFFYSHRISNFLRVGLQPHPHLSPANYFSWSNQNQDGRVPFGSGRCPTPISTNLNSVDALNGQLQKNIPPENKYSPNSKNQIPFGIKNLNTQSQQNHHSSSFASSKQVSFGGRKTTV